MSSEVPSVVLVPVGDYSTDTDANCETYIADGALVLDKSLVCDWLFNVKKVSLNIRELDLDGSEFSNETNIYERIPTSAFVILGNFIQTVDGKDRLATQYGLGEFASTTTSVGYNLNFQVFVYRGVWYRTAYLTGAGESDVLTDDTHTWVNDTGLGITTSTSTVLERFYP